MNTTFTSDRIEQLRGLDVYDRKGDKIGSVEEVFIDKQTGQPEWIGLGTGFFGTKRVLVPVQGADVRNDGVFVPYDKDQVKDTPDIDSDEISQETEQRLYAYYGLRYSERRSDTGLPEGADSGDLAEVMRDKAAMTRSEEELRVGKRGTSRGRSDAFVIDGGGAAGLTRDELYAEAKRLDIQGRSKMNKRELARAVESARQRTRRRRETGAANPVEVQSFLEGVGYPTRKADLVREAEGQGASEDVLATLKRIRDEKFDSPADVSEAIGRLT